MSTKPKRRDVLLVSLTDKDARLYSFSEQPSSEKEINETQNPKERFKVKRVFSRASGGMTIQLEPIDKSVLKERFESAAAKLAEHLDRKKLLVDVLQELPESDIKELEQRLAKKPSIKTKHGCFDLMVGGKKGGPYQLNIR